MKNIIILSIVGVILALVLGYFAYKYWQNGGVVQEGFTSSYPYVNNISKIEIKQLEGECLSLCGVFAYDENGNNIIKATSTNKNITDTAGAKTNVDNLNTIGYDTSNMSILQTPSNYADSGTGVIGYPNRALTLNAYNSSRNLNNVLNENNNYINTFNDLITPDLKYTNGTTATTYTNANDLLVYGGPFPASVPRKSCFSVSGSIPNYTPITYSSGTWTLTFKNPQNISAIEIFSRKDYTISRLKIEVNLYNQNSLVCKGVYEPKLKTDINTLSEDAHRVFVIQQPTSIVNTDIKSFKGFTSPIITPTFVDTSSTQAITSSTTPITSTTKAATTSTAPITSSTAPITSSTTPITSSTAPITSTTLATTTSTAPTTTLATTTSTRPTTTLATTTSTAPTTTLGTTTSTRPTTTLATTTSTAPTTTLATTTSTRPTTTLATTTTTMPITATITPGDASIKTIIQNINVPPATVVSSPPDSLILNKNVRMVNKIVITPPESVDGAIEIAGLLVINKDMQIINIIPKTAETDKLINKSFYINVPIDSTNNNYTIEDLNNQNTSISIPEANSITTIKNTPLVINFNTYLDVNRLALLMNTNGEKFNNGSIALYKDNDIIYMWKQIPITNKASYLMIPQTVEQFINNSQMRNSNNYRTKERFALISTFSVITGTNVLPSQIPTSTTAGQTTTTPGQTTTSTRGQTTTTAGQTTTSTRGQTTTTPGQTTTSTRGQTTTTTGQTTTTTLPNNMLNDLLSQVPNISDEKLKTLLDAGIDLVSLLSQNGASQQGPLTETGMNMNFNHQGPATNLLARDFSGTSNVFTPFLYYEKGTKERFTDISNSNNNKNVSQYYKF